MSKRIGRRGDREEFWRRLIRDHRQSGTSIKQFCQSRGVSEASYFAWRKKLAATKQSNPDDFIAVRLIPDAAAPASGVEILVDRGRRVRVEPGFDRQLLRDVLAVFEEQPC